MELLSLKGKKILVTGASRGIGRKIAENFSTQGADVILLGSNKERLEKVKSELVGSEVFVEECDLSDGDEIESFIKKVNSDYGGVDILVLNAGITKDNLLMRMSYEDWERVIQVNLSSNFRLIKGFTRSMMKKKFGRVINISSVVGVSGNPGQANYCASKAGSIGLCKSVALELASRNITVNNIAPGFIESDMTNQLTEEQKKEVLARIPMKKMGIAQDIANVAMFLASDKASYITGQTIHVNGGMYLV